jgi:serine O-acetyltransferase
VKRHPTVRDRATLGANATLVGDITIGEDATVGAGAVVVEDVPPGATVVGNPAQRVDDGAEDAADGEREANGERADVPAPGSAASDTDPAESGHDAGLAETDADFRGAEDGAVPESGSPCCDAARSP